MDPQDPREEGKDGWDGRREPSKAWLLSLPGPFVASSPPGYSVGPSEMRVFMGKGSFVGSVVHRGEWVSSVSGLLWGKEILVSVPYSWMGWWAKARETLLQRLPESLPQRAQHIKVPDFGA